MIALFAFAAVAAPTAPVAAPDPVKCDNRPVVMMVEGATKDAKRLAVYAAAIRASGLYQKLGGYYLVNPRPVAVFEGVSPPERSIIAVHFPCFAHARAFWNSKEYREKIVPLRSNPAAGDFIVTVHMVLPVPDYAAGPSSTDGIAQIETGAK
jgi:uncharacterized protein (DUF1330 family)